MYDHELTAARCEELQALTSVEVDYVIGLNTYKTLDYVVDAAMKSMIHYYEIACKCVNDDEFMENYINKNYVEMETMRYHDYYNFMGVYCMLFSSFRDVDVYQDKLRDMYENLISNFSSRKHDFIAKHNKEEK